MFTNYINFAAATGDSAAGAGGSITGSSLYMVVMLGLMGLVFYFMILRPQKKKEKAQKNLRESIQVGDVVTTIGGITGIVVRKNEDSVVIETGGDKSKIRVKIWAISENETVHDEQEQASASKKKKID